MLRYIMIGALAAVMAAWSGIAIFHFANGPESAATVSDVSMTSDNFIQGLEKLKQLTPEFATAKGKLKDILPDFSDQTPTLQSSAEDKEKQAVAMQAKQARVIVTVEPELQVGENKIAQLTVQQGAGEGAVALTSGQTVASDVSVPITRFATAAAIAMTANIDIEKPDGFRDTQAISFAMPTVWTWKVVPRSAGHASFLVILEHKVAIDGKDTVVGVQSFPQKINVTIGPWTALQGWLTASTTFISAISGFIGAVIGLFAYFGIKRTEAKGSPTGAK